MPTQKTIGNRIRRYTDLQKLNEKVRNVLTGRMVVHEKAANADG